MNNKKSIKELIKEGGLFQWDAPIPEKDFLIEINQRQYPELADFITSMVVNDLRLGNAPYWRIFQETLEVGAKKYAEYHTQ